MRLAEERLKAFEDKADELKSDRRPRADRKAELRGLDPAEAVLDLKVLDPAMGSGHFLVTAVDFLSDYIADLVEYAPVVPEWLDGAYESPLVARVAAIRGEILRRADEAGWTLGEAQLTDQTIIRRMVLKRCIYGVDKNPMAVELAKVSLWLHSFTVGASLSFLDQPPALRRLAARAARAGRTKGLRTFGRPERQQRRHLRARLDALYFHLYGLDRDDAGYVLSTFPIVRREDEAQFDGRYRTRELILAYMNALAAGDPETVVSA